MDITTGFAEGRGQHMEKLVVLVLGVVLSVAGCGRVVTYSYREPGHGKTYKLEVASGTHPSYLVTVPDEWHESDPNALAWCSRVSTNLDPNKPDLEISSWRDGMALMVLPGEKTGIVQQRFYFSLDGGPEREIGPNQWGHWTFTLPNTKDNTTHQLKIRTVYLEHTGEKIVEESIYYVKMSGTPGVHEWLVDPQHRPRR